QPYPLAGHELVDLLLDNGAQLAVIEANRDLDATAPRRSLLDRLTGDAAADRAQHAGNRRAAASTNAAARDAAGDAARSRADTGARAFDRHRTYRLHRREPHRLLAQRLAAGV